MPEPLTSPLSIVVLVSLITGVLYAALAWVLRARLDTLGVAIVRLTTRIYLRIVHGLRRVKDPLPKTGAAIVVANHRSGIDPPVLSVHSCRQIRFLMASEYFQMRGLTWLYRQLKTIPVKRDGRDLAATKEALKALYAGEVIGIFPEGEIREEGLSESSEEEHKAQKDSSDVKEGAALLALKTGAPIITAYIEGTPMHESVLHAFLIPSRSRVTFGKPLVLSTGRVQRPSKEELRAATQKIVDTLLSLRAGSPISAGSDKIKSEAEFRV